MMLLMSTMPSGEISSNNTGHFITEKSTGGTNAITSPFALMAGEWAALLTDVGQALHQIKIAQQRQRAM